VTPLALWVIPVADVGGVARHVIDVTRAGIPGYDVAVLCPEGALAERLREQGTRVHVAKFGPSAGVRASRISLNRAIAQLRPAIVHTHLAYADTVAALVRLPHASIRVSTEHGIAGDDRLYHSSALKAEIMKRLHRWRLSQTRGIIAVSAATRDAMMAQWKPNTEISVIYNGVDQPTPLPGAATGDALRVVPAATNPIRVLSLSRLSPEKRIDTLIEAFGQLQRQNPDATLIVAGEGPLRGQLQALVAERGLQDSVTFPGHVNPAVAFAEATVVAQLSEWENCSYTLLDARVAGLGIVATAVGGNPELLDAEQLVNPEDADEIVAALRREHRAGERHPRPWGSVEEMCQNIAARYDVWRL
jgi:glycosyltransferase involved in cell wall biosynthesis